MSKEIRLGELYKLADAIIAQAIKDYYHLTRALARKDLKDREEKEYYFAKLKMFFVSDWFVLLEYLAKEDYSASKQEWNANLGQIYLDKLDRIIGQKNVTLKTCRR